jgi:hypothetical protein
LFYQLTQRYFYFVTPEVAPCVDEGEGVPVGSEQHDRGHWLLVETRHHDQGFDALAQFLSVEDQLQELADGGALGVHEVGQFRLFDGEAHELAELFDVPVVDTLIEEYGLAV